jgi:rhodanese-related sulfurtransferase
LLSLEDAANFLSITGKAIVLGGVGYTTISPAQLHERLASGEQLLLIDVREAAEHELARVEGAELLPLSRFDEWAQSLDPEVEAVVMCHHGIRSAHVCAYLARQGFKNVANLEGGIDRWSCEVDGSVPRY